ncbi:MAG: M14 metallopeptidase family protein [Ferruginibacter sp.]
MKNFSPLFIFFFSLLMGTHAQSIKSPDAFLGYQLGNKFTPHYKIVQYFEEAAKAMPALMKLETYGKTYEGRPLLLAAITSPENFMNLEKIRLNNLRLTGMLTDAPGDINGPAIVWLSYNVHGNEASSSEVSMKVLYELLKGNNAQVEQWLRNTVVLIDPCLNPDGRDRYVNWYNQTTGAIPNAAEEAREHAEPWPGGRTNHYYFDLNRDWAWQTQIETQARIKKYNEWMPQIHCDFHEQSPTSPYYFAPAAEPFHEVITPFQRSFQTIIGKNHAKYFDANGWLYFTKEYFDLFYPSYGDTYPIYNGAIGMTYEQAGHGRAGLAIELPGDDTLRLTDRIAHHFTTSMSTIETTSAHASEVMNAFKKYFDDGKNAASGPYKTYIISGQNESAIKSLKTLFDKNQIAYGYATAPKPVKVYNYFTGKDESYSITKSDLVLSSAQPKSVLLKVLFEPNALLIDSATYDITAWSLPYAYGVQAWASKEAVPVQQLFTAIPSANMVNENAYGYLINYKGYADGKLLAALLKNNIKTRFAEKDFSYNGMNFKKGTLVILRNGNEKNIRKALDLAAAYQSQLTIVSSGFMDSGFDFGSDKLHQIKKPNVALLSGRESSANAMGEVWHLFDQQLQYPLTLINAENFNMASLKKTDVLIIPDGNYRFMSNKETITDLKSWVKQGGKIIAMENAAVQWGSNDAGFTLKKAATEDEEKKDTSAAKLYENVKRYEDREKENISNNIPGAIYKVSLDDSHPLAFGYPNFYFTLKLNDNLYKFSKDVWNVGIIKKEKQVSGFVGNKLLNRMQDGTVIGVEEMGRGSIIYFADDPLFRSFWENGKLLFLNAVFLVGE